MKLLKLTQGKQTLLDDRDWEWAKQWKWYARYDGWNYYAHSKGRLLHRELLKLQKGDKKQVDHINSNGLDNRKVNLRICTPAENQQNQRPQNKIKSSKFKGIFWDNTKRKWVGLIKADGKRIRTGIHSTELEAAKAYDKAAVKYFGDFARLNFPRKKGLNDHP
jgi:G3E family GTPase